MPVDWCDIFSFIKTDSSIPVLKTLAGKVILQTRAGVQTALGGGGHLVYMICAMVINFIIKENKELELFCPRERASTSTKSI